MTFIFLLAGCFLYVPRRAGMTFIFPLAGCFLYVPRRAGMTHGTSHTSLTALIPRPRRPWYEWQVFPRFRSKFPHPVGTEDHTLLALVPRPRRPWYG